jgi:hypothetical protein
LVKEKAMRWICVATAVALGALCVPVFGGLTDPAATHSPNTRIDRSEIEHWEDLEITPSNHALRDPQADEEWSFTPPDRNDPARRFAVSRAQATRPQPLREGPIAPLPPPMLIGPLGIGLAAWAAYRAKKRGGRV